MMHDDDGDGEQHFLHPVVLPYPLFSNHYYFFATTWLRDGATPAHVIG